MSSNERLSLFSFEIWCSLGDEELNRSKSENFTYSLKEGVVEVPKNSFKKSHKFFHALFDQLFDVCINYINIENENEEEDTWDISKACNYILGIIVQLVESEKIDKVLTYVINNFDNQNLMLKNSSILIFAAAIDSSHKNKVYEVVKVYFDKIILAMDNENERIKKSATYLMFKVTKVFSKNLGPNSVDNLFNKCLVLLNFNNKNSNKICSIFSNLIKGRGDLTTVKNDSKKILK
jgi:hypothetical protein